MHLLTAAATFDVLLIRLCLQNQRSTFPNVFFAPTLHDHTSCTNGVFNDSLPYCLPATEGGYHQPLRPLLC
jgi:hypothetical protein